MHTDDGNDRELRRMAAHSLRQGENEKALTGYLHLAERGYVDCQRVVGGMYYKGYGAPKDLEKAKYWYKRAADRNDAKSQYFLASIYRQEGKLKTAIEWLEKSSNQGHVLATFRLAINYSRGRGVPVDQEKALVLMEEAARGGNIKAKMEYAKLLMKGRKGFVNIFLGVYLLILSFRDVFRIMEENENDERLKF